MVDVADIFSDPMRMEALVSAVERMSLGVDKLGDVAVGVAKKLNIELKDIERASTGIDNTLTKMEERWMNAHTATEKLRAGFINMLSSADTAVERHAAKWRKFWREQTQAKGALGMVGGDSGLGVSGTKSPLAALKSKHMQLLQQLPMGGMLGVMMYGQIKKEGFRANTASILRTMDSIGGASKRLSGQVRSDVQGLYQDILSDAKGVEATLTALKAANIDSDIAALGVSAEKSSPPIHRLLAAIDRTTNSPVGTTATAFATAAEATGEAYEGLTKKFMGLHRLSETTKTDFGQLIGVMSQGTSTLRVQRQGVGDLADAYLSLKEGLAGGSMQGMESGAIKSAALKGVGAMVQGVGGLNEGLMGYIAQRIHKRTGRGPSDAFEAMTSLKLGGMNAPGVEGGGGGHLGMMVKELKKFAEESIGGSKMRQIGGLAKVGGFSLEAARAIIESKGHTKDLKAIMGKMQSPTDLIAESMKKQLKTVNKIEKAMERGMTHLGTVGSELLNVLMTGFKGLGAVLIHNASGNFGLGRAGKATQKLKGVGMDTLGALFNAGNNVDYRMGQYENSGGSAPVPEDSSSNVDRIKKRIMDAAGGSFSNKDKVALDAAVQQSLDAASNYTDNPFTGESANSAVLSKIKQNYRARSTDRDIDFKNMSPKVITIRANKDVQSPEREKERAEKPKES